MRRRRRGCFVDFRSPFLFCLPSSSTANNTVPLRTYKSVFCVGTTEMLRGIRQRRSSKSGRFFRSQPCRTHLSQASLRETSFDDGAAAAVKIDIAVSSSPSCSAFIKMDSQICSLRVGGREGGSNDWRGGFWLLLLLVGSFSKRSLLLLLPPPPPPPDSSPPPPPSLDQWPLLVPPFSTPKFVASLPPSPPPLVIALLVEKMLKALSSSLRLLCSPPSPLSDCHLRSRSGDDALLTVS